MKIYILGATGFLGSKFNEYLRNEGHETFTEKIDVTDFVSLKKQLNEKKPDVVINFAGVRAYPTVDWCEDNKEQTVAVNVGGAINFTLASLDAGAFPIMISSGCMYSGGPEKEFTEEDIPNFEGSFYSKMRIAMQKALEDLPVLQLRIRMPISKYSHPRNFIDKITSYEKVISIPNSVTLLEDLWPAIIKLVEKRPIGILNVTNDGYVEHSKILEVYNEIVDPEHSYTPISLEELQGVGGITKAKRSNCVLCNKKLKSLGIEMPALDEERLREIMKVYKQSKSEQTSNQTEGVCDVC